jgi:hypothetical protein
MSFLLKRTYKLDDIAPEWKGAYLTLREPTFKQTQDISNLKKGDSYLQLFSVVKELLVDGRAYDGDKKELVEVTSENVEDLPMSVLKGAIGFLFSRTKPGGDTQK